jgi:hypothetical protein
MRLSKPTWMMGAIARSAIRHPLKCDNGGPFSFKEVLAVPSRWTFCEEIVAFGQHMALLVSSLTIGAVCPGSREVLERDHFEWVVQVSNHPSRPGITAHFSSLEGDMLTAPQGLSVMPSENGHDSQSSSQSDGMLFRIIDPFRLRN